MYDQIFFVFGSDLGGRYETENAKIALQHFGSTRKISEGINGNAYAIPTKDAHLENLPLHEVQYKVNNFLQYAKEHPEIMFFVTRVGCDANGFTNAEIAPFFKGAPTNMDFPKEWSEFLLEKSKSRKRFVISQVEH